MDGALIDPTPDHHVVKFNPTESSSPDELKVAFFDYDQSELKSDAIEALRFNVAWLKNHPGAQVQIEGHCDERGSEDYNVELGQERADAARDFLVRNGIDAARITTISYGAIPGQNKKNWPSNRKAAFIVVYAE